jgi:D-tyrosyl-tRNA(Tyr) deacylase
MISVIQRVLEARVEVDGRVVGEIGRGLVSLTAVHAQDTDADLKKTAEKLLQLRVFPNGEKAFDLDVTQIVSEAGDAGGLLVVSNFTVAADTTGGRRPALHPAASPAVAREKFDELLSLLRSRYSRVETGVFGADMKVTIVNDGPVTLIYDTRG